MTYHRITRREFYDLVWSHPLTRLAKRFGISDVALGKACRAAQIPHPPVGYWAKLEAGKKVVKADLPPRGLGQSDVIEFGQDPYRSYYKSDDEVLAQPVPTTPIFSEDMDAVRERAAKIAKKAPIRKALSHPHPLVEGLLAADEKRKEALAQSTYGYVLDKPLFDTPIEKRRLKILNYLFLALAYCGCKPSIRGKEAQELYMRVGDALISFKLGSRANVLEQPVRRGASDAPGRLMLKLSWWEDSADIRLQWEDTDESKLEDQLEDIVVGMLIAGEWMYRATQMHNYTYEVERRQKIEAEIQRKKEEAEQLERERIAKLKRDKRRQLVTEMLSWRRANDLREYIRAARQKAHDSGDAQLIKKTEQWAAWATAEADDMDPLLRLAQQPGRD